MVSVQISPANSEPEPQPPQDLWDALATSPAALTMWEDTTTLARVGWIHWVESAKQAATRKRRVANACEMISGGHQRVCCFDTSAFYSKRPSAPQALK